MSVEAFFLQVTLEMFLTGTLTLVSCSSQSLPLDGGRVAFLTPNSGNWREGKGVLVWRWTTAASKMTPEKKIIQLEGPETPPEHLYQPEQMVGRTSVGAGACTGVIHGVNEPVLESQRSQLAAAVLQEESGGARRLSPLISAGKKNKSSLEKRASRCHLSQQTLGESSAVHHRTLSPGGWVCVCEHPPPGTHLESASTIRHKHCSVSWAWWTSLFYRSLFPTSFSFSDPSWNDESGRCRPPSRGGPSPSWDRSNDKDPSTTPRRGDARRPRRQVGRRNADVSTLGPVLSFWDASVSTGSKKKRSLFLK